MIDKITVYKNLHHLADVQPPGASSVWIHIDDNLSQIDREAVGKLITLGCVNILISGKIAREAENVIDEIVEDISDHLVLTSVCFGEDVDCLEQYKSILDVSGRDINYWSAVMLSGNRDEIAVFYERIRRLFGNVIANGEF